jgi:hypothetical protein
VPGGLDVGAGGGGRSGQGQQPGLADQSVFVGTSSCAGYRTAISVAVNTSAGPVGVGRAGSRASVYRTWPGSAQHAIRLC